MHLLDQIQSSAIVPQLALVPPLPAKKAGWLPKGERVPLPRMILKQMRGMRKWRRKLVKSVYYQRAEVYPIDDRGRIPVMNELGIIRALSKRSKLHGAVQVLLDVLTTRQRNMVYVLVFRHADSKEPIVVWIPLESVPLRQRATA